MGLFGVDLPTIGGGNSGTLIGAGLGFLAGGPAGAGIGAQFGGGLDANANSAAQANKQMDFQQRMRETAHQTEVNDLKLAGLNPLLSANGGAATPSGAQGTVQNVAQGMAASAMEMKQMQMQAEKQKEEIANLQAGRAYTKAQEKKTNLESDVLKKDANEASIKKEMTDYWIRPFFEKIKQMDTLSNKGASKAWDFIKNPMQWNMTPQKPVKMPKKD